VSVVTWDDNRRAINELWPRFAPMPAERALWHADLAPLDQPTLRDALHNVKRARSYDVPALAWVLDEYRTLDRARRSATRPARPVERKLDLRIDPDVDARHAAEFTAYIDLATPGDFVTVESRILDALPGMSSVTALRLLAYARRRLLGTPQRMGRVDDAGNVTPIVDDRRPVDVNADRRSVAPAGRSDDEATGDTPDTETPF